MSSLILPPHLQQKYRPHRAIPTEELVQELVHREVIRELAGQLAMPADDPQLKVDRAAMLAQTLNSLLQQMGVAAAQAQPPLALLFTTLQTDPICPGKTQEIVGAKVLLCRHPNLDGKTLVPAAPGEQPALPKSSPVSVSETS